MKRIFLIILLIIAIFNTHAQFAAALSKNGFVRLNNDSIILSVPAGVRGDLQWQSTNDSITWENEEASPDNALAFKPVGIKSYRLVIKESTCDSLFSDTCKVFPANTTIPEYIACGIGALDLFNVGIMVGTLEQYGIQEQDLIDAGLTGYVSDVEGNHYKWVKIGTQIWMAENLRSSHYNDGSSIPLVTDINEWWKLEYSDKAYCWYNNDSSNYANIFGALYTWQAATNDGLNKSGDTEITQGVCPDGWHLPDDDEWTVLIDYLGGWEIAGGKLKSTGNTYWVNNYGATNETGFSALPGGFRTRYGGFEGTGYYAYYWTDHASGTALSYRLYNNYAAIGGYNAYLEQGYSVRCVKNE